MGKAAAYAKGKKYRNPIDSTFQLGHLLFVLSTVPSAKDIVVS